MKFEYLDEITSDQMFRAYGKTLPEVFRHAAMAMFGVMYDLEEISLEKEIDVTAQGSDEEQLLYDWLSNLLIEFEVEGIFFADFSIKKIEKTAEGHLQLLGIGKGNTKMPELRTHVKGVTF
ncbi:MAG: archease, partial [Candidatus Thorarchaeota archaeon]